MQKTYRNKYQKRGFTVTGQTRKYLFLAFQENREEKLTRIEIIEKMVEKIPELTDDNDEIRYGIFDGIIHKREVIPIPYVEKIGKGHKSYFIYTGKK